MAIESGPRLRGARHPVEELRQDLDRAREGADRVLLLFEHVLMDEIGARRSWRESSRCGRPPSSRAAVDGHPTEKIAEVLSISRVTGQSDYSGINRTLGVSSKAAAVAEAFRRGILA